MRGEILKINLLLGAVLIFILSAFLFFPGSAVTSSSGNFTVTPDNVSVNWTAGQINITSDNDSVVLLIHNVSTNVEPQYFDENKYSGGDYAGYDSAKIWICFTNGMAFLVQNSSTGTYTNMTDTLNENNSTIYNLIAHQYCPPGYYFGYYNVTQSGTGDYAKPNASVNIPVNPENTFSETNSTAFVKGTLTANTDLIHKYFFNTSLAENITGVTINLSGYTQDADLYLFDSSGNLLDRSVENGSSREEIYRKLPGTPDIWEMWIWGNVTSQQDYFADMYFTTLNVTNASDEEVSSIDFGDLSPENNESSEVNITIKNEDTKVWTGVRERSEIYRVETWDSKNVADDYYFLVPHFAEKVKVKMEWEGGTRWYISLNSSSGVFLGNSSEKYKTGNKTDTVQEENILYSGAINTTNDGLWKLTVGNLSEEMVDEYNLTVYVWYDSSALLDSDYPAGGFDFNSTGSANSDRNVSLKITLPSPNVSNGTHEGFIEYYKPSEWNLRVPISFKVTAGNLIVNNSFETTSEIRYDNVGFNRLGAGVINVTLPINNTGDHDIYFVGSTSDNSLKKDPNYMNISVDWPSNPIQAGSSDEMNISISINTSNTGNSPGIYTGWVMLNTANSTNASSTSYPFENLTIGLSVDLVWNLTVNVTDVFPTLITPPSNNTNMTLNVSVELANGTVVSTDQKIDESNFLNAYLEEGNTSYKTFTALENFTNSSTGGTWSVLCPTGYNYCRLNGTLLSGRPGGLYYAYASVRLNTSVFGGTGMWLYGTGKSMMQTAVDDTGLKITEWYDIDILEGQEKIYVITISNYGYKDAVDVQVRFDKGADCPVEVDIEGANTSCPSKGAGNDTDTDWEFDVNKYSNCTLGWELTAQSVNENTDCDAQIIFRTAHTNYGDREVDIDIADNVTTDGGEEDGDAAPPLMCTSNASCASDKYCKNGVCTAISCPSGWYAENHKCVEYEKELSITDYTSKIYIMQGGENSTDATVKNIGDLDDLKVKMKVDTELEGLTTEITPTSYSLDSGSSGVFAINFSASNTTEVGYHEITIKAYSTAYSDIYTTKNITLAVMPLEETKKKINQTCNEMEDLFASLVSRFSQIPSSSESNYTLANRTYSRLLNMFTDIENYIKAGNYLDAYALMKEANSSLTQFEEQIEKLLFVGGQIPLDILTMAAIAAVVLVIGGFLAYLLLPPRKGFHPTFGYKPKEKLSITDKLKQVFSHVKKLKDVGRGQRTLAQFEKSMPIGKERPTPLPEKTPDKKTYMKGYERHENFGLSYDKKKLKPKKKWFGK